MSIRTFGLAVVLMTSFQWGAATFGQGTYAERYRVLKDQLLEPERVTLGVTDSFQGVVTPDEKYLIFTKSLQMAKHIHVQNLQTGESSALFDLSFDTRDPHISPDGETLLFTSFRRDARGDIASVRLKEGRAVGEIEYLTSGGAEDGSPFWIDSDRIGYLSRVEPKSDAVSLIFLKLSDRTLDLVETGAIVHPTLSSAFSAPLLAYVRSDQESKWIELLRVTDLKRIRLDVELPGFVSFPRFSADAKHLYFGQYAMDTNSDDVVNANDQSAVFRVDLSGIFTGNPAPVVSRAPFPITSSESNCNYPAVSKSALWMTCARRGILNVYRLPKDGVLPDGWKTDRFARACEIARSYEERLFLHYAEAALLPVDRTALFSRLLGEYLLAGQLRSADYYLRRLREKQDTPAYAILSRLLAVEIERRQEPPGRLRPEFISSVERAIREIEKQKAEPAFRAVALALCEQWIGKTNSAKRRIAGVKIAELDSPLKLHYAARAAEEVQPTEVAATLFEIAHSRELEEISKSYYGYRFLVAVGREKRIGEFKRVLQKIPATEPVRMMTELELLVNQLKTNPREGEERAVFAEIQKLIVNTRSRYFLQRAMLVRTILVMVERGLWQAMYDFARLWVDYTSTKDMEMIYARKQFLDASLEIAYARWQAGEIKFAGDRFYFSVRLTDNLEAHHGLVQSIVRTGHGRAQVEKEYASLEKEGFVGESVIYVQALLRAIELRSAKGANAEELRAAAENLEKLKSTNLNPAVHYLLLGALYLEVFSHRATPFDSASFEKAHRYLMMSYDLGIENPRVAPQALLNLALLHYRKGNRGESRAFFEMRRQYPVTPDEDMVIAWFHSKVLFGLGMPGLAEDTISRVLQEPHAAKRPEFLERKAFYALHSGRYAEAVQTYEQLLKRLPALAGEGAIRVRMAYAYALFKLDRQAKANEEFRRLEKALQAERVFPLPARPGASLPKVAYELKVLGYLAQLETDSTVKEALLDRRYRLLKAESGNLNLLLLRPEDYRRELILIRNAQAKLAYARRDYDRAFELLKETVPELESLWTLSRNPLDPPLFQGVQNLMVTMLKMDPARVEAKVRSQTEGIAKKMIEALDATGVLQSKAVFNPRIGKFKAYAALFRSDLAADARTSELTSIVEDLKAQGYAKLARRMETWL